MGRFLTAIGLLLTLGCDGDVHKQIHGHIHVVTKRDDALVAPAVQALVEQGAQALPQIETALHTARPQGRSRLVEVLGRIRHAETVPLLRHIALYDADARVRELAEGTIVRWAEEADAGPRGDAARLALQHLGAARAKGLGPLVREQ